MEPKWDKIESTYLWEIYLDKQKNLQEHLRGYSKKINQAEAMCKIDLFQRKVLMLDRNGYFEKMLYINIFIRNPDCAFMDKMTAIPFVTLYPTSWRLDYPNASTSSKDERWNRIHDFMLKFFELKKQNKSTQNLMPKRNWQASVDKYLDVMKWDFKLPHELYRHCQKCINNGMPYEAVNAFQRKYEALKPFANEFAKKETQSINSIMKKIYQP